jgi:hypothetical protein
MCAPACSVYDSGLLVTQKPDAVKTMTADSGSMDSIVDPESPGDAAASGPGPDEQPTDSNDGVRCGDGVVTGSEKCDISIPSDQPGACPTDCPKLDKCTQRALNGTACQTECVVLELVCMAGDGCCPGKCTQDNDPDCSPSCGDGIVQSNRGETCEKSGESAPCKMSDADCDDGDPCTADKLTGSAANCNADCSHTPITSPTAGDGCCPKNGNANVDADCKPMCGNGVKEGDEQCDGGDGCDADCKVKATADQTRCMDAAKTDCEKCACMSCTASELACRMSADDNNNTLCSAIVACAQKNDCVGTPCYCGAGPICGLPYGPCVNEIEAGAGSTDLTVITQKLNDPTSPVGLSNAADTCRTMQCRSACR